MNQQKIIWGALVLSSFLYVFIAYTLAPDPPLTFTESVSTAMTLCLYGAAFVFFMTAFAVPGMLARSPQVLKLKPIVTMAMFEACAVMGLAAAVIQHDWRLIIPPWIGAMIGFMREFPRDEVSAPA